MLLSFLSFNVVDTQYVQVPYDTVTFNNGTISPTGASPLLDDNTETYWTLQPDQLNATVSANFSQPSSVRIIT